jgi:glycosyltransferase involved in cell wall biosynthesis
MRIAIDARWIFPEISGIGAYTRELIAHLAKLDRENEYVLLFHDPSLMERTVRETGIGGLDRFAPCLVKWGVFSPMSQLALPGWLRRRRIDVFHSTNYMIPLLAFPRRRSGRMRCVVTIHDVIPLLFRDRVPMSRKARLFPVYVWLMRQIGRRADAIVTDSRASAADIVGQLRLPPAAADRVRAIYCGVSERFRPRQAQAAPPAGKPRVILYVGRFDPYKNVTVAIRAFAQARSRCPFPLVLKLVGSPDPRYPEARECIAALGLKDEVIWSGYVPDDRLLALYHEADVLLHPSMYEGFGLQVVEAMACGVPVICSNAGALPEVTADAAIRLDPSDVDGYARAIERVLTDPALAARLSESGRRRASTFSWTRTAEETLAVYREAVN